MTAGTFERRSTPILVSRAGQRRIMRGSTLTAVVTVLLLIAALSFADAPNDVTGIEQQRFAPANFDVRTSMDVHVEPTPTQVAALEGLSGVTVRWNAQTAFPAVLIRYGGTLTETDTEPLAFLRDNIALFGLTADDLETVQPLNEYRTAHNGATHVQLQQVDQDRTVYGSLIKLTLDRDDRVVIAGGTFFPGARVDLEPELSADDAELVAAGSVGVDATEARSITSELVTFPMPPGHDDRLGWNVTMDSGSGWYEMVVDARTSDLLLRRDLAAHAPEADVFTVQNPTLGSQQIVSLDGAPFNDAGWVTDRTTSGNNANAYQDFDNDDVSDYQPQSPPLGDPDYQRFIYTFTDAYVMSGGTDVMTDRDVAITQAFYTVNWLHDYFYTLGFDEPAGNFQDNNFGRGGLGGDGMDVEVHNDTITPVACPDPETPCTTRKASNTQALADGVRPRMELNVGLVDSAMDADLITHEYTHGVMNRLLANGQIPQDEQSWALGEGWSDFFGTSVWDDPIAGEYVCGNPTTGCPIYAYDATPLVYSHLCTLAVTTDNPGGCEPHRDGEIWTAALWDLRTAFIDQYGATTGKEMTELLVIDGAKNTTPPKATFLDARDGILAADVLDGGTNQCTIWRVFASREMGLSASTSADQETVVAATDVPVACVPTADAGGAYATTEGSDVTLDATNATAGTDPSAGGLTYEWDLDDDGDYDDATGVNPVFTTVGQDGAFSVALRVANEAGLSDTDTTTVTVSNVAPSVALDTIGLSVEGDTVLLSGVASDPGWLDPLTATIDWDDGAGALPLGGTVENARPDATLSFSQSHTYGDDGIFNVEVCVSDDDTTTCRTGSAIVANIDPDVGILATGQTTYDGVTAYIVHAGDTITVAAEFSDPGSDDLTMVWDWDDGTASVVTSLVNPPAPDQLKSPSIQPRELIESVSHDYSDACLYEMEVSATDDDSGHGSDAATILAVGKGTTIRGSGWWMNQYRDKPPNEYTTATLDCYLAITVFMSTVFDVPLARVDAVDILFVKQNKGSSYELFDEQLMAAWLNFADGSVSLTHPVDADGDGHDDATFAGALLAAETVRNDPGSTPSQILAHKDVLERIVTP